MTSSSPAPRRPETLAVTAGRPAPVIDAPLNPPVVFSSTYVGSFDTGDGTLGYGRSGNPTWAALEEAIGGLEGGRALTFASGMAAAHAVLELFDAKAVVVLPNNCYLGVSAAIDQRVERLGWEVRRVDVTDTVGVLAASAEADLLWLESPTNPTIEVADLPAIGAGLSPHTRFVVDNTFATPLLQRPLESGADVVLHSATKLISGHSDVLLGALVTQPDDDDTYTTLLSLRSFLGATPGPMEAYLALRGLRTLPVRLSAAQASAQLLAERLTAHPRVRAVRYPGLPTDAGHQTAHRAMDGNGTLISIELENAEAADAVVARCELWVFATSLGGVESTIERRRRWAGELTTVPEGLVRLSVGIEHVEDLWADLAQALGV